MKLTKLAMVITCALAVTACSEEGTKLESSPAVAQPQSAKPTVSDSVTYDELGNVAVTYVGVHDPSVIENDGTYYIFGSHLAAAKSTDLLNWEMISSPSVEVGSEPGTDILLVNESPLFDYNYLTEISEGVEWTDGYPSNWAANVIDSPDGKFWFYYNSCGQHNTSTEEILNDQVCWDRGYLGLAEADNIEGPYKDKGIFLRSGYRNQTEFVAYPLDNGQTTYDGGIDPNVIDPAAFYDTEGKLWMVYGSHHGGIFILAMDESTGKPEAGQGYGKHLLGGAGRFIEGPFVMYSPESDYYYLFYSVGGLDLNGGYSIRVARSKTPDGPYLDTAGNDIAAVGGLEIGEKLLGGFEYTQGVGETSPAWGYQAPGHNSAYYDEKTGRNLLVTHTRFPQTSTPFPNIAEAHQVRVHEMFINSLGWPVTSPQRYVPLEGDNLVVAEQLYGYYKFINHSTDVNTSPVRSTHIALNADHSVTGDEAGIWYMVDDSNVKLELESGTYYGVAKWQWDDGKKDLVVTFSAVSLENATVWGSKVAEIDETTSVLATVSDALNINTELTIDDEGYSLPTKGKAGTTIRWESSNEYYIDANGSIFIPTPDRGDQAVTLTANMSLNGETITKTFNVNLKARPVFRNALAHYSFENGLTDNLSNLADAMTTDNNLDNTGVGTPAYAAGQTGQAFNFDGATGVRLPDDIINSDSFTVSFWSKPDVITDYSPAFFAAENADRWVSYIPGGASHFTPNSVLWSRYLVEPEVEQWNQVIHSQKVVAGQWSHVTITYANGIMKYYSNGTLVGSMPRPDMFSADTAKFALGVNFGWNTPFQGQIDEFMTTHSIALILTQQQLIT